MRTSLRRKFTVKDVIDDIFDSSLTPYNKKEWEKVMMLFFSNLKDMMLDEEVTDITLKNFATIRVKPITSIREAKGFCTLYSMGVMTEEQIKVVMIKLSNIYTINHEKRKVREIFEQTLPHFDECLGSSDWWTDLRLSFGARPIENQNAPRGSAAHPNRHGDSTNE